VELLFQVTKFVLTVKNVREFDSFTWVDYSNPKDDEILSFTQTYPLNAFLIEDITQHGHNPKFERHPEFNFLILRAYSGESLRNTSDIPSITGKISLLITENKLVSFHRVDFDFLQLEPLPKFESIHHAVWYVFSHAIGTFNHPLEQLSQRIDTLEENILLRNPDRIPLQRLYYTKLQSRKIKRLLQLNSEVFDELSRELPGVAQTNDIKDRLSRMILDFEDVLENTMSLMNTFISLNGKKNNDVMRLLTVISMFFMPLTFLVGVYGMNFENMPELQWKYGYIAVWIVMLLTVIWIFWWFRRKKIL
jgi:magnesium transporter